MRTGSANSQIDVLEALTGLRVLPVASVDPDSAGRVGTTLVAAGLPCLEIAYRRDDATESIRRARQVPGLLVGAGTVLEPAQAVQAAEAGAAFAVSPALNPDVVRQCSHLGLPFVPGVATPTEVDHAIRLGIRTVKLYPAALLGGVGYLRALAAVYPDVRFIPTGGIDASTLGDYLALPNVVACGGSWLVKDTTAGNGAIDELKLRIGETLAVAR